MAAYSVTTIARFWSKVAVGRPTACWPWRASCDRYGYGQFKIDATDPPVRSHRVAYELANGDADPEAKVRHSCDNRACCNPDHLLIGTQADNHTDREVRGRCPRAGGRFAPL